MEYQNFKLEIDEQGIAVFTANRPEKMNALNDLSWAEMNQFFTWADKADEVKVIIVTGAGEKAFIAGADLNSLKTKKSTDCLGGAGQKALDLIQKCSKPVIAAVNGYAFGGGCETAIACDFRVVSEDALFALPETGLGLLPGAGGTQRLARLIGLGRAQDVILLGRKIGGPEAVQIGLATKCVPKTDLMAEAKKMASKLIAKGPVAIRIAKRVVQASIEKHHVTRLSAIPTVLTALLNQPDFDRYDLSSIHTISYSTCPMPPELIKRALKHFNCGFQQSYGMTEMGSIVTMLTEEEHIKDNMRYLNSVGRPIEDHKVKIIADDGSECAPGETGEIVVTGPGMMKDYYKMPDETKEVMVDGWYHTRDMGYLDENGYLYISGRKSDMIISGGENIFPLEVENVLRMREDIAEVCVLGVPDDYWGESVQAVVVLRPGSKLTPEEIRTFCRGKIAGYKIPKKVYIWEELPKNTTGKVCKAEVLKKIEM